MTDIIDLAKRLHRAIKWQGTPETVDWMDQVELIKEAIRLSYVHSGRTNLFSEDLFVTQESDDGEIQILFSNDMLEDEKQWVLMTAQIEFYKMVQAGHDDDVSYTTDAMSVTHGDKPYEHIGASIDRLENDRRIVWTRMVRYNQLGVAI